MTVSAELSCYFDLMIVYPVFENFRWVLEGDEDVVVNDWSSYSNYRKRLEPHKYAVMFLFLLI